VDRAHPPNTRNAPVTFQSWNVTRVGSCVKRRPDPRGRGGVRGGLR
jgi:hypothetical protein